MSERALSSCKKKRGVIKASLTRLGNRLGDAEWSTDPEEARHLTARLKSLAAEFKVHYYSVIDLLDDPDDLEVQQEILDEHDDYMSLSSPAAWRNLSLPVLLKTPVFSRLLPSV